MGGSTWKDIGRMFVSIPGVNDPITQHRKHEKRHGRNEVREQEAGFTAAQRRAEARIAADEESAMSKLRRSRRRVIAGYGGNHGGTIATSSIGIPSGSAGGQGMSIGG